MEAIELYFHRFRESLEYTAWKNGWGDIANWTNHIPGVHITAAQALLSAAFLSPFIFIAILVTWYSRTGQPRMNDRPGATGEESSMAQLKKYVVSSRLSGFFKVWVTTAIVILMLLFFLPDFSEMIGYNINGIGSVNATSSAFAIATFFFIFMYTYNDQYIGHGEYLLGYKKGMFFRKRLILPLNTRLAHILINGPTGGGKTTGYVEPQIICDAMAGNISCFAIDVKPDEDLIDNVAAAWTANGAKVVYINPWDQSSKFSINPLLDCKGQINDSDTYAKVAIIVDAIFKAHEAEVGVSSADASYFETQERDLLWGLIAALLESPAEMRNLPTLYALTRRPLIEILAFIANLKAPIVMREIQSFANMNDKQKNDFMSGLRVKLSIFGMPGVSERFLNNDFELERFFKEPTLVVVKSPLDKPSSFKVATLMTRLMMMYHYRSAEDMKKTGHHAFYFLDEFGSLRIPNITNIATTIRSSNGGLVILLHDRADLLGQGIRRAGTVSPQAMDSSLRTQIVIADSHPDTCKYYSNTMGTMAYKDQEKMRNVFNMLSFNYRTVIKEAPLMTLDQIKYMDEDESLIFLPNKRGIKLKQERVYERKTYSQYKGMPYIVEEPDDKKPRYSMASIDESLFENDGDMESLLNTLSNPQQKSAVTAPSAGESSTIDIVQAVEPTGVNGQENGNQAVGKLRDQADVGFPDFTEDFEKTAADEMLDVLE